MLLSEDSSDFSQSHPQSNCQSHDWLIFRLASTSLSAISMKTCKLLTIISSVLLQGTACYSQEHIYEDVFLLLYSRVPNKRGGGENNRGGGLEIVRHNNNRGVGIIGGGLLREIENSPFLR